MSAMKKSYIFTFIIILTIILASLSVVSAESNAIAPGWIQVVSDGFGDTRTSVQSLEVFSGYLYAGTWSIDEGHPAQVWRSPDGKSWSQVTPPWDNSSQVVLDMITFNGHLYLSLSPSTDTGGEIWRTSNGTSWERVVQGGFGDIDKYVRVFAVFSDMIFTTTFHMSAGPEIWSSTTGDMGDWTQVSTVEFNEGNAEQDITMDVFGDYVYVGIGRVFNEVTTAELWRSDDGTNWIPVFTDGLGDANNTHVSAMEEFNGYFYIGLRNVVTGGEVWRSIDGENWSSVFTGGSGDPENTRPYGLTAFNDRLYLTMNNQATGPLVWDSSDGIAWHIIAENGWGVPGNTYADYFDNGNAIFNGGLYLGTLNPTTGGQIWLFLANKVFLPILVR
jgi:hypothetical protein